MVANDLELLVAVFESTCETDLQIGVRICF